MDIEKDETTDSSDEYEDLDPYEINFLPIFRQGRGSEKPFINQYGVLIGDHEYVSEQSPLEQWTENTNPEVMSGDQWVHSFKDIGFQTAENRDYFEKGIMPKSGIFMHPDKNVAYEYGLSQNLAGDESQNKSSNKKKS
jgi:hypothetical protein